MICRSIVPHPKLQDDLKYIPATPLPSYGARLSIIDGVPVEWRIARGSAARFNYRSEIS